MIEVDARGLACPIPVVRTMKTMSEQPGAEIVVLVSNEAAKENVTRLARGRGYRVDSGMAPDGFRLVLNHRGS